MPNTASNPYWKVVGVAGALAVTAASHAQDISTGTIDPLATGGIQAAAVTAVVMGSTTSLADVGTVTSPSEPRGNGMSYGSIPGLLTAETPHAAAMAWTDQGAAEASLANLAMTLAGTGISADFIQSRTLAVTGAGATGKASIEGLKIGGVPISPSGVPNQVISLPGLSVTLNEQIRSTSGIVLNAVRVRTLDGTADVILGSSKAGI